MSCVGQLPPVPGQCTRRPAHMAETGFIRDCLTLRMGHLPCSLQAVMPAAVWAPPLPKGGD